MANKLLKNGNLNTEATRKLAEAFGLKSPEELLKLADGDNRSMAQVAGNILGSGVKPEKPLNILETSFNTRDGKVVFCMKLKTTRRTVIYKWDGNADGPYIQHSRGRRLRPSGNRTWDDIRKKALEILIKGVEQLELWDKVEAELGIDRDDYASISTEDAEAAAEDL